MSEKAQSDAVLALLETAGARPYTVDALAALAAPPSYYTEVHVSEVVVERYRQGGRSSNTRAWRLQTRVVGEKFANAQNLRRIVTETLRDARLTVDGRTSTPIHRAASDDPIAEDEEWYSGMSEWRYAH